MKDQLVSGEGVVERVARAIANHEWDAACSALGTPNMPRGGNWTAKLAVARAAIEALQSEIQPTEAITPEKGITMTRMHIANGVYFERHANGAVRIVRAADFEAPETELLASFNPSTWASVVAFVSATGENSDTIQRALKLHEGSEG
jgi:hypothetical protein